eukprot:99145-Alexandrium_andersonii.AAC.1
MLSGSHKARAPLDRLRATLDAIRDPQAIEEHGDTFAQLTCGKSAAIFSMFEAMLVDAWWPQLLTSAPQAHRQWLTHWALTL